MRILVTNDDGINAPGLTVAKNIAREIAGVNGEVITIAPATEQSGVGHCISYIRPTLIEKRSENEYSVEGSPADCVLAGLYHVLKNKKPDLILSGVNQGQNVAEDVLYSGTVGAAMEGAFQGVMSIALSQSYNSKSLQSKHMYEAAEKCGGEICRKLMTVKRWKTKTFSGFYNVNFPACRYEEIAGTKVCETGKRQKSAFSLEPIKANWGKEFLWIKHDPKTAITSKGSDASLLKSNHITVSPLKTELTWKEKINDLAEIFEDT